ncbi:MAG TPA: rRNA maturation RNase YbeY [Gemmatimonadaceae bacterium]|nr:rRNA maturation RNase YbeY [Gemmatimonadaceae bacterium]
MSVAVDVSRDGVRIALSEERVREIVRAVCRRERVREALISVAFVRNATIARMNREFLGHSGATDVITFELDGGRTRSSRRAILGDIYIAPEVARRNAIENGVAIREELTRVIVHGTLHVLGYTHAEGSHRTTGDMWRRQEEILASIA